MTKLIVNKAATGYDAYQHKLIKDAELEATRLDRDDLFAMSFCYSPHPD